MDLGVICGISTMLTNSQSYVDAVEFPYFVSFYNQSLYSLVYSLILSLSSFPLVVLFDLWSIHWY
jgi:hypothetical protein